MLIDKLVNRITQLTAPIVVGLDPRLAEVPTHIKEKTFHDLGRTPAAVAEILIQFNKQIIDQICDIVPAVKPQIAMYEQFGPAGFEAYLQTIKYAKEKGLIVVGDIKRGDIASTAEAYSHMHIGRVEIDGEKFELAQTDFITVNPYMGADSIEPYLSDCKNYDKGLFVLVKTSNKGSRDIQDVLISSKREFFDYDERPEIPMPCPGCRITENLAPLYAHVGELVETWGAEFIGECGYSNIGAVVGATHPSEAAELRKFMPKTFFLVPGYGAQGGSGKDLKDLWAKNFGAIVNSSRGITGAYKTDKYKCDEKDFAKAARQAALDMKADLEAFLP